jgi:Na+-driven multidrug efflux pump
MTIEKTSQKSEIQSESYCQHRKQRTLQILLPIWLGILVVLAVAVLVILTAAGKGPEDMLTSAAGTALIWLILPALLFALIFCLLLFGLIYLLAKVLNILPSYTNLAQQYAKLIAALVLLWANKAVSPIISVRGLGASVRTLFRGLFGISED